MIAKYVNKMQDWAEDKLRQLCGRITPEKRLTVILVMLLLFAIASIYVLTSAIYQIGKNEGHRIEIEHIQMLELQKRDSINNQLKFYDNGRSKK